MTRDLSHRTGVTSIVVSHDLASIFSISDRIAFLHDGRVHLLGTGEEFRHSGDPVGSFEGPMKTPGF
jgi:phospholipid/cholesterol/gamma-HCH transport system ATP-binding protein